MKKFKQYLLEINIPNKSDFDIIKKIEKNPLELATIKNPTKKMKLAALYSKHNFSNHIIGVIKNPDEEMQAIAVRNDPFFAIKNIKNPSERIQLLAFQTYIHYLSKDKRIKLPIPKGGNILSILPLKNILNFQIKLIKISPFAILLISRPSIKIQEFSLSRDITLLTKYPNKFSSSIKKKYKHIISPLKIGIFNDND